MSAAASPEPTRHDFQAADREAPLVPVRMVNEWVYCPRLAYLEWVEGAWADSGDTAEGRRVHARTDAGGSELPPPDELDDTTPKARSVLLSSERLGIIARIDVVESDDGFVTPVDFKKGKRPHTALGAYDPERVQVCAQAMILEDNGYRVREGALWFAGSRERVRIELTPDLRERTMRAANELRQAAAEFTRPPPLDHSPKCVRCSLAGICLPDETTFFAKANAPRPLNPSADTALPLYISTPGARVRKSGETLVIEAEEDDGDRAKTRTSRTEVPFIDVSELALFGPVSLTTPTLHELLSREIPVSWFSTGGWLMGHTVGTGRRNAAVKAEQFRAAFDPARCLALARGIVAAKVRNQRTLLRRNWRDERGQQGKPEALERMSRIADRAAVADSMPLLLGLEGEAASIYFEHFEKLLTPAAPHFQFSTRTRRPPTDPVNALLSMSYALLTRTLLATLQAVGFEPYQGFYHQPRHGRPALALDMMEPYRPIIADSCVLQVINNGEVQRDDFVHNGPACALKPSGRKALIAAYERRLGQETTHPLFGYQVSMRRLIEVQMRLLARHLDGELPDYPHYIPR
jgi:CRISPR-associated exonuclease Cas4/CRISPR-associated protein Cas1